MSLSLHRFLAALVLSLAGPPGRPWDPPAGRPQRRRRTVLLDVDTAPEPLLRDLGILDGRGLPHRPGDPRQHG